jgi:nicotinate-nucleotide adenylyltransferase
VATGIFGGTFDPVHIGHLRTALEISRVLKLDRMLMIPCGDPPHRGAPQTPGQQRLEMVKLAVSGEPGLVADDREIRRGGLSYSIDTVVELRGELGADESLCFCVGMDSLKNLNSWHRWQELLDYCHLVVAGRPGYTLPGGGEVAEWLGRYLTGDTETLAQTPAGRVFVDQMTLLPVSATGLRQKLQVGESIRYLTPDNVIDYIVRHRLYVQ